MFVVTASTVGLDWSQWQIINCTCMSQNCQLPGHLVRVSNTGLISPSAKCFFSFLHDKRSEITDFVYQQARQQCICYILLWFLLTWPFIHLKTIKITRFHLGIGDCDCFIEVRFTVTKGRIFGTFSTDLLIEGSRLIQVCSIQVDCTVLICFDLQMVILCFFPVVVGSCDHFGFGFTTFIWKPFIPVILPDIPYCAKVLVTGTCLIATIIVSP